jgi:hypothetical protein
MSTSKQICTLALLIIGAAAMTSGGWAQDAQEPQAPEAQGKPKPAARAIPSLGDTDVQDVNAVADPLAGWRADTAPLTGLQTPSIGNPELKHSYWVPGLQYGSMIQDQPIGSSSSGNWYSSNYFVGNLSLMEEWRRSQLALNYSGGGFLTTQPGQSNGWYQQLALGQSMVWQRWQVQLNDQFSYLPESQFGFGTGTGLALPGIGGSLGPSVPGIGGSVVPNQSIYAAVGPRYSNSFLAQITYQLSRRGSLTVGGSYGLLRFTQSGNIDTDSYIGNVGYNYMLTKNDSLGVSYRSTSYHYQGQAQAMMDQTVLTTYGRTITRRMALQIYGGPEITNYRVPVSDQTQTIAGTGGLSLTYAFERGSLSASYFHALSAGGGVLIGSNMDQVTFTGTRSLTRTWSVQGNLGFAKNRPLASQTGVQGNDYNSIYVGGAVTRPIGRNLNFSLAYNAQIQKINPTVCTGSGCNRSSTVNIVTLNLQWHTRPFVLP